jgi:hypothetical protein
MIQPGHFAASLSEVTTYRVGVSEPTETDQITVANFCTSWSKTVRLRSVPELHAFLYLS